MPLRCHGGVPLYPWFCERNRLIHGYDTVDEEIVWETIHAELVELEAALSVLRSDV